MLNVMVLFPGSLSPSRRSGVGASTLGTACLPPSPTGKIFTYWNSLLDYKLHEGGRQCLFILPSPIKRILTYFFIISQKNLYAGYGDGRIN